MAAFDRAGGVGPHECDLLREGGAAAEVGDVGHVHTAGDDEFDDRLAEQVAGDGDGDGSDAGDLAQFSA
ncbi:MAG: hypothetical protein ACRDVN_13265, partial [Jiangellaceae bacterium]